MIRCLLVSKFVEVSAPRLLRPHLPRAVGTSRALEVATPVAVCEIPHTIFSLVTFHKTSVRICEIARAPDSMQYRRVEGGRRWPHQRAIAPIRIICWTRFRPETTRGWHPIWN